MNITCVGMGLVVGGTSGLGMALARNMAKQQSVIVTGRHDPECPPLEYRQFTINDHSRAKTAVQLIESLPELDTLVFAPGFYQEGTVTDLEEADIERMLHVCLTSCIYLVRAVLKKQGKFRQLVAITSTSQYTPRRLEPVYTVAKAGLGAFANSMSLDGRIGQTLVVAPAGMKTRFHDGRNVDTTTYNDPEWVADQISAQLRDAYQYRFVKILREPARVVVEESR